MRVGEIHQIGDGLYDGHVFGFIRPVPAVVADLVTIFFRILGDELQGKDTVHIALRLLGQQHVEIRIHTLIVADATVAAVESGGGQGPAAELAVGVL